jgi:hypothetical protein
MADKAVVLPMYTNEVTVSSFNTNNLTDCASPYLQHCADQPVHWQPWSSETLEFARQQNKPILLSIGYAACAWCRKMGEESFSNTQTAQLMNQRFVNILVDREQRADLDKLYQQAHVALNQRSGGWPLTIFLEPKSLLPFFAGTYFSPQAADGQPSFNQLLMTINDIYHQKYSDVLEMCVTIKQQIQPKVDVSEVEIPFNSDVLASLVEQFLADFNAHVDPDWGGLKGAPKFPQPLLYQTLLNTIVYYRPANSERLYQHLMRAAQSMSKIGLFDHLAGGFFRYSVDHYWGVPHFEKRLTDNALLMNWYANLANFNKEGSLAYIAQQTYRWITHELHMNNGLVASALSADSEQQEGRFYWFDKDEIEALLEPSQWPLAKVAFGLEQAPNVNGHWHLHCWYSPESLAQKLSLPLKQVQWSLEPIKQKLLEYRNHRVRPIREEQAITGWNALFASALLTTGQLVNDESMLDTAETILKTIHNRLWKNQQLYRSEYQNEAHQHAFLDDYAALGNALIDALVYQWQTPSFNWLLALTEHIIHRFYRANHGLIYSEAKDLPMPSVLFNDDALPNGCAMTVNLLSQLSKLVGNQQYENIIHALFSLAYPLLTDAPLAHASLLNAFLLHHRQSVIVLRGSASELSQWRAELQPVLSQTHRLFYIANETDLPQDLASRYPVSNQCYAAICVTSQPPTFCYSVAELITAAKQS